MKNLEKIYNYKKPDLLTTGGVCYNIIYEINDTKVPNGTMRSIGTLGRFVL